MDKNIKELLGPHKNSGYLGSCGYGFMAISLSNFKLECLENQNFSTDRNGDFPALNIPEIR